jgi:hypothetical protein
MAPLIKIWFAIAFFWLPCAAFSQSESELVQQVMEYLLENDETELDYTDLQLDLLGYLQKPLDINKTNHHELGLLGFLTEPEIAAILAHRQLYGQFMYIYELQSVDGLGLERARLLSYFVQCGEGAPKASLSDMVHEGNGDLLVRYKTIVQQQSGYISHMPGEKPYEGSPFQLMCRAGFRYNNRLSMGLTAEKDMGEAFFGGNQGQGFDFYSGHIHYAHGGVLRSLSLGDYQVQFGQGVALWSGLSFGKSAEPLLVARRPRKLLPYRSINENQFLRGAAATFGLGPWELTAFVSKKKLDGAVGYDSLGQALSHSTLSLDGFHRTATELAKKDAIGEQILGSCLEWNRKGYRVGAVYYLTSYTPGMQKPHTPYQLHDLYGKGYATSSLYHAGSFGKVYLFGELAINNIDINSLSGIQGMIAPLTNTMEIALLHRHYAPGYHTAYYGAFREQSKVENEAGTYVGIHYAPHTHWLFKAYIDRFRFPWLRYQADMPSYGHEYLVEVQYKPSRNFVMICRIRSQLKEANLPGDAGHLSPLVGESTTHYRLQARFNTIAGLTATCRGEYAAYTRAGGTRYSGALVFQDFAFKPLDKKYHLCMRYAVFHVQDYGARIYAYENDVLYAYSVPAYTGRGQRMYILLKYKPIRGIECWLRYAVTQYGDRSTIGSGNEAIAGNTRGELKVQARFRF